MIFEHIWFFSLYYFFLFPSEKLHRNINIVCFVLIDYTLFCPSVIIRRKVDSMFTLETIGLELDYLVDFVNETY